MGFKDLSLLQHNDFGQVSRIPQSQLGPMVTASKKKACVGIWALVRGCSKAGGSFRGAAVLPDLYAFYQVLGFREHPAVSETVPGEGLLLA